MREYFPFRFFDPLRRKWVKARYVAELAAIADRYEQWEAIGPPELRSETRCNHTNRGPKRPHNDQA